MTGRPDVMPAGRFEWERAVLRIVLPDLHGRLALVLSHHASPDGTNVRPGNDLLAAMTRRSRRTIIRTINDLRAWGLLEQTRRGGGNGNNGRPAVYRLTIPLDFLDRFELIDPDGRPKPDSRETPRSWGDTQMSLQFSKSPVDKRPESVDNHTETVDNPDRDSKVEVTKQGGYSRVEVTPGCRTTTHRTTQRTNSPWQETGELPTHALARAPPPLASPPSFNPTTLHTGAHP